MNLRSLAVFLATIGGLGKIRWAPGTWGSLVGLLAGIVTVHWFRWPLWIMLLGLGLKFIICAFICTVAEREIGIHDAPSIILDEVWAMAAVVILNAELVRWWPELLVGFVFFRVFDVTKPPPLKLLATLPEGWGIMADDLGAAVYTAAVMWTIAALLASYLH